MITLKINNTEIQVENGTSVMKAAENLREKFRGKFGQTCWTALVPA